MLVQLTERNLEYSEASFASETCCCLPRVLIMAQENRRDADSHRRSGGFEGVECRSHQKRWPGEWKGPSVRGNTPVDMIASKARGRGSTPSPFTPQDLAERGPPKPGQPYAKLVVYFLKQPAQWEQSLALSALSKLVLYRFPSTNPTGASASYSAKSFLLVALQRRR